MSKVRETAVRMHKLYEVVSLPLLGTHEDRRFVPSIDRGGQVHLNVLQPGACAGNHYHERVRELFINPGPGELLLHLRDPRTGRTQRVVLPPASLSHVMACGAKLGVPHMLENPNPHTVALIIVVDQDDPTDVIPAPVYGSSR